MKKSYFLLNSILIIILVFAANIAHAQVTAGPSDVTSPPPTTTADAGKIVCYGSSISISGPQDASGHDYAKYHWYKLDASGNKQESTITGRTYTETSAAAGYYNYEVVTENANTCTSPLSDVFKVYVLPQLTATITTPNNSLCGLATNATLLTANPTPATGYTLTYQWTRNGVAIPGATTSTYNVTGETTTGTINFGVTIGYALNSSCTGTATQDIIITPVPDKPMITAN